MNDIKPPSSFEQVSVIVPVKNEAASIRALLQGLLSQTHRPTEIVIADGGSTDHTKEIIRDCQISSPIPIVLIETEQSLPGAARNRAIEQAANEWIATIDAGIRPRPDWLAQLIAEAKRDPQAEVIYGIAKAATDSYFTECAAITYVPAGQVAKSIASCLLRRSAWSKVGGFPEDLRSSEDLLFFKRLDAVGARTIKCPSAVVTWELQPTIAATFRRFVTYSRNGIRAGLAHEWQYNVSALYLMILALLLAGLWFWPLLLVPLGILILRAEKRIWNSHLDERRWRELVNPRRILTVAWINMVIDMATFYGMWQWLIHDQLRIKREEH